MFYSFFIIGILKSIYISNNSALLWVVAACWINTVQDLAVMECAPLDNMESHKSLGYPPHYHLDCETPPNSAL